MSIEEALPILIRMICSFLAAFTAIALWSRVRDAVWTLIVLGSVFLLIESLYNMLVIIGLASYQLLVIGGFPMLETLLSSLSPILLAAGFIVFIIRDRRY